MEFDEFVKQFRERTAQRMVEFEKALAKAQAEMERQEGKSVSGHRKGHSAPLPPNPMMSQTRKTPGRGRRGAGPIQGVLKKF